MSAFAIAPVHADYAAVLHEGRKVAILTPAKPPVMWAGVVLHHAEPWSIIPDPEAFPDPACTGLPRPLQPVGMDFGSLAAVEVFLGIAAPEGLEAAA